MTNAARAGTTNSAQSFIDATSWEAVGDHSFRGEIDPVWAQGRAVYGGVVAAGLTRAMKALAAEDTALRGFSVTFAGPVESGTVECTTDLLRRGRSATFVQSEVVQDGTKRAVATATFGAPRSSSLHVPGPSRPDVPPPDGIDPMPYIEGLLPSFTQRFEFRYTHGKYPFSGVEGESIGGWCRFRQDSDPADTSGILALLDGWPAPALQNMKTPAPASSITWSADLFAERLDVRLNEWWYFDARTVFAADGYTSFEASLWAPDGQYVARSCQLVGIFG